MVEELRHLKKEWDYFLTSTNIPRDPKGYIPLYVQEITLHSLEAMKEDVTRERKGKEIEESSSRQTTS